LSNPSTASGWAKRLSAELQASHGPKRFPVDVERLALDYTQRNFDDPITKVVGEQLEDFEGGLFPSPSGKPRWLIAYNSAISLKERIRYTLAHELGHYLLHRRPGKRIQCRPQDMSIWRGEYKRREVEANRFAAGVLMPTDDYCRQIDGQPIDLELFRFCAGRYGVSLTPAILEWLSFTPELAILVRSLDGFIDWGVSSTPAFRNGAFFRTRGCPPRPVPENSLAAQMDNGASSGRREHPRGVWLPRFEVTELAIASDRYDMTLSLLLLHCE
jgi:IrrE N-terminal-like domain